MKKIVIAMLTVVFISAGFGCGVGQAEKGALKKAHDFTLNDINGKPVKLSDYSGRVIILNFFATWCPPCRMEMPDFNEISKESAGGAQVIAVNVGEPASKVRQFADEFGLTFPVLIDDGGVSRAYGPIRAIPVTVVIDKNFNIAREYIGARSGSVFRQDINDLE
ncbi:MAG: TlpA disulfide reductase family protein [Candidatus Omnitrophota bacterium]